MAFSWQLGIAKLLGLIHLLFILFFVLGWLLPVPVLRWHLFSIPIVILQWKLNNEQCILTQWQLYLEGKDIDPADEGQFVKGLFKKIGLEPTRPQLFWVIYGLLAVSGALSAIRIGL